MGFSLRVGAHLGVVSGILVSMVSVAGATPTMSQPTMVAPVLLGALPQLSAPGCEVDRVRRFPGGGQDTVGHCPPSAYRDIPPGLMFGGTVSPSGTHMGTHRRNLSLKVVFPPGAVDRTTSVAVTRLTGNKLKNVPTGHLPVIAFGLKFSSERSRPVVQTLNMPATITIDAPGITRKTGVDVVSPSGQWRTYPDRVAVAGRLVVSFVHQDNYVVYNLKN